MTISAVFIIGTYYNNDKAVYKLYLTKNLKSRNLLREHGCMVVIEKTNDCNGLNASL